MGWNSSLYISLDREFVWKLLKYYSIPQNFITIIKNCYRGTACRIIHEGQLSENFEVRQGCLLSPFSFVSKLHLEILDYDWLKDNRKWQWLGHTLYEDHQTALPDKHGIGIHKGKEREVSHETPGGRIEK